MTSLDVVVVSLAGLACGIVNSVAGGGSLILFPALLATGMSPLAANVTNSVATWPGYLGGVAGFRDDLPNSRARLRPLVSATVAGSTAGCVLLLVTPSAAFDVVVPFLVLVATGLTAAQPWAKRRFTTRSDVSDRGVPVAAVVSVGLAAVYGGYFGGALGVIFLAVLGLTLADSLVKLNAFKAVLSVADASVSVVMFGMFGPVGWVAVAVAAPATLLGGFVGARFARRLDERVLRVVVVCLGLAVAAYLFVADLG
ncbi:MAG: sulfite exporter TauE/SafE family protein [Acidimicrobiales bacterium]|nr:sulfite exporter TauE/SafE family protein [Acidimicrobiales bacterium]